VTITKEEALFYKNKLVKIVKSNKFVEYGYPFSIGEKGLFLITERKRDLWISFEDIKEIESDPKKPRWWKEEYDKLLEGN